MKSLWFYYLRSFKDIISHSSIFTTLIVSVLLYSFFYPTAYRAQQAEALPIIIVDEEQSDLTTRIIDKVAQSPNVKIKAMTGNFSEAKQWVESQHASGILLLPENLSQSLRHGETGGIGLYLSTTNFLATKHIETGLAAAIEQTLIDYSERFGQISDFSPALSVHPIALFNPLSGYGSYIFPAVAPLIIHQGLLLGFSMLIAVYQERQISLNAQALTGMCLAVFTIGCLGCLYLFGFSFWLFDYPRGGNLPGMLLAVPVFIYCVLGISCLFASILDMPERAGHVLVFTSIPLFMLSGVAWPHSAMPVWVRLMGEILPSTQIIQMFIQLNQMGVPTTLIVPKLIYLGLVGSLCFVLAYQRLTGRQKR